jgi:hypothetical protein
LLDVLGDVTMNGTVVLNNSIFWQQKLPLESLLQEVHKLQHKPALLLQLTSKANTPARVLIDSFGTSNTAYPIIAGRNARGTVDAPTATQNNDILLRLLVTLMVPQDMHHLVMQESILWLLKIIQTQIVVLE